MLKIVVKVSARRDTAALLEIMDGSKTLVRDQACTRSDNKSAAQRYNPGHDPLRPGGHSPLGRYQLTAHEPTPAEAASEYGVELFLFEPLSGQALEAEAFGRLGLLLYAGSPGQDGQLRRTQGGVRLTEAAMQTFRSHLAADSAAELIIEPLTPPPWWAFWRRNRTPKHLSQDPPRFTSAPLDEASLLAALLRKSSRAARTTERTTTDNDVWQDRDSGSGTQSGSEYRGGGGAGGGGGASGGWTDAPTAGRGPGVNAAGVIAGAAAATAVAAAMAAPAHASQSSASTTGSSESVTDRAESAGDRVESAGDSGETISSDSGSDGSSSQTNTAY
jgi:uncharacterized membrane protein YgcG